MYNVDAPNGTFKHNLNDINYLIQLGLIVAKLSVYITTMGMVKVVGRGASN